jgi:hypothetical protein
MVEAAVVPLNAWDLLLALHLLIATVSGPASVELSLPQRSLARLMQYLTDKESP